MNDRSNSANFLWIRVLLNRYHSMEWNEILTTVNPELPLDPSSKVRTIRSPQGKEAPMDRVAQFVLSRTVPSVPAETANQWTHAFGWFLSLVGSIPLMRALAVKGGSWELLGGTIYVVTLLALYGASTLSHSFDDPSRRHVFRMIDQICIFLIMVGQYTAFSITHLRTGPWWIVLGLMWAAALVGIVVRIRAGERSVHHGWYLSMCIFPAVAVGQVLAVTGVAGLSYVLLGGAAYLVGLWFFVNDHRHIYYHAVWHCCVILGSVFHYLFLYRSLVSPSIA